eukprot:TRINITY_DN3432_c0_g1_i1.p1 TRINITY_DN3432_c0_g1~~TRINITY_DN3432_c0_g1_i1.p1  ORF type:complete len:312 (-),score=59.24 TRINITY_DN3432_c0_g1_i1:60-995(-)
MRTVIFVLFAALLVACVAAHGGHGKHGNKHGGDRQQFWKEMKEKFDQSCSADMKNLCPDVDLSEHPIKTAFSSECIKENEQQLSAECHQMLREWREMVSQWQNRPTGEDKPENNDDKDDDDDDKKEGNEDFEQAFLEACHDDQVALCPEMQGKVTPHEFFKAKCAHQPPGVSEKCKVFFQKWREARMAVFGVLISSTFATMFAGLLACLSICCCIAICVKRSKVRRCRRASARAAKQAAKHAAAKTADIEQQPAQQETPIVVNGEDMANMYPMQAMGAYSMPYPQYWAAQPTMLYAAPPQMVPTEEAKPIN